MALTDLFKKFINASDDDDYEEGTEEIAQEGFESPSFSSASSRDYDYDYEDAFDEYSEEATIAF